MKTTKLTRDDADRMVPLLRAISREMRERIRAISTLEARLTALSDSPRLHAEELANVQSELSTQRRELRRTERELIELGCRLDLDHPLRIVVPARGGAVAFEGKLDGTQFFRQRIDARR